MKHSAQSQIMVEKFPNYRMFQEIMSQETFTPKIEEYSWLVLYMYVLALTFGAAFEARGLILSSIFYLYLSNNRSIKLLKHQ